MPRFKLTIEYAGTRYSGWQVQKNARTVQGEIARAVREVTGRSDFELYGSGRTDAGVHAVAQVAHLDVAKALPPATFIARLNESLPADINLLSIEPVSHRFHARHDAVGRRYVYQLARRRTAFAKPFVWWVKEPLDASRMRAAATTLVGMKDFRAYAESDDDRDVADASGRPRSTLVLLERLDVIEDGDLLLVAIEGSHFLWKMVRRIVGVLVEIGRGSLDPDDAARLLQADSDLPARLTAPAAGLFLERVFYRGDGRGAPRPITPLPSRLPATSRTTPA